MSGWWWKRRSRYATREELKAAITQINQEVAAVEASQQQHQAEIDADTAAVQAVDQKLVTVQQEVDALKQQSGAENLDFSGLDSALGGLSTQADTDVADAAPAQPAPTPPAGP